MPVIQDVLDSLKIIEELHRKKNEDYASTDNPHSNFDITAEGIRNFNNPRDVAYAWPIYNKLARLANLLNKAMNGDTTVNNESIEDSLIDTATYALLWKADIVRRNEPLTLSGSAATRLEDLPAPDYTRPAGPQYPNLGFGSVVYTKEMNDNQRANRHDG